MAHWISGLSVSFGMLLTTSLASAVDPNSLTAVKRPLGAVELAWLDATATSYCIRRGVSFPLTNPVGGSLTLTYTETPPPMPLWLYDVEESTSCVSTACSPAATLACEVPQVTGNNGAPGSTSVIASYPSCGGLDTSGPEYTYSFTPSQDLAVSLALSGLGANLDVFVLEDRGTGCDPLQCVATGDTTAPFNAVAGSTYFVVIDGRMGAVSDYTLDLTCSGTRCAPTSPLTCGSTTPGNNAAAGSTRVLSSYSPCGATGLDGHETVYSFSSPTDATVTMTLGGMTGDLDIMLLDDAGAGCLATACTAAGDTQIQFAATAGRAYFIAVDGRNGAVSDFSLQTTCSAPPPAGCTPAGNLVCGSAVFGRTDDAGSTDRIDSYPCGGGDASGPEFAYTFTASNSGDVTFRLSPSTAGGVDLYVLGAGTGCNASSCVAFGDTEVTVPLTSGETVYVVLDGPAAAGYSLTTLCSFPPGACTPVLPLRCGDVLFGDTGSGQATDVNDAYPCSPNTMTGKEMTYEFSPPDRLMDYLVSVTMELFTEDLDLFAIRNQGMGCDPEGCIAWGDREISFPAAAAGQYFLTVDGRDDVVSGFRVLVSCVTAPGACTPADTLSCGQVLTGRSNGGPGSTDVIDAYTSCPPIVFDESGPEFTYRFDATRDETVTVDAINPVGGTPHLFVLEDMGSGCDATSCVAKGTTRVVFSARAGRTYYIITDGFQGAVSTFDLAMTCN